MRSRLVATLLSLVAAGCLGVPDSTGADAGGDGGVVAPCGGVGAFVERFDGDALAEARWNRAGDGATLEVADGVLTWTIAAADATTVLTSDYHPAFDGTLELRLAHAPQSTTSLQIGLAPPGALPAVSFQIDDGALSPGSFAGPLPDGTVLRFRFAVGALRLEVEPPGQDAVELDSQVWDPDAPFAVWISARGGVAGADPFTIDSIEGAPAVPWCAASQLFEDFNDDDELVFLGDCTLGGGELTMGTCVAATTEPVDVRDGFVSLDVLEAEDVTLRLFLGDGRQLVLERAAGDLLFRDGATTVGGLSGGFPRLRFVHAGGQICGEGLDGEFRSVGCVEVDDAAAAEARPVMTSAGGARVDNLRGR